MNTDWMPRNPIITAVRWIFAIIDQVVYGLLSIMYQIFFTISGLDIFTSDVLRTIYTRVQIILGVFMVFKLAVTILQGLVNPDVVLDKKRGMGTIVSRIIVSLLMLSLMAPLNISATNEWEKQVNNHGILFGTLFSLQNRILSNNTIGRLIIGPGVSEQMTSPDNLSKVGSLFSSTVLKTFIFPNVVAGTNNKVCPNIDSDVLSTYNNPSSSAGEILSLINVGCESEGGLFASIIGSGKYAFSYFLGLSTIAGIVIVVILIGYCVDVAVRVFKLAILRLIAPVPIISHINISAKEGKGEDSFSLWTKALISTYLDLFIRLAVIYIVLFFVQTILVSGWQTTINYGSGNILIGAFAQLFIIIGLMFFAKQAPKYIKEVLGFKGSPSIGMTAMSTIMGNIQGGERVGSFKDAVSMFGTVNETVAKTNFGDKSEGHGLMYNTKKATIKKIQEDYDRDLRQEYYKRGLDIDDYSYQIKNNAGNVMGTVEGLDRSHYSKHLFEDAKSVKARSSADALSNNKYRYTARMNTHAPSDGRGVTARTGDTEHTSAYTTPGQYVYTNSSDGRTMRYSDMPPKGSHSEPPDSSKNPPSTPPTTP